MAKNVKKRTAMDATVKAQLAGLTLKNEQLLKERDAALTENELLRKQNVELANVIETDLKADAKIRIMAASNYKESDLETLGIEQLQQIEDTLARSKSDVALPYKSIRAGAASKRGGPTTVGSLYGKTREEILAMEGDF